MVLEDTALLLNAVVRGEDGKTPWERACGGPFNQSMLGNAEFELFKLPVKGPRSDPDGNIFAEGVLSAEIQIPVNPPTTFYMKKGEIFASACLIATFAALGVAAVRRRD